MLNKQLKLESDLKWENIKILDAYTEEEKQAIYHFRYQIHIKEMNRIIPSTDHFRKVIIDELDSWSQLAYAKLSDGRIIGTVRATFGKASDFPTELARTFQLNRFQNFNPNSKNICFGTKMMVDPLYRKTPVFFRLLARCYEFLREHNIQFNLSGCNPYLLPMYEQLGYQSFAAGFQDPGYGFVVPILLMPEDIEHLIAIRSPYLRIAKKYTNSTAARDWYLTNFPEASRFPVNLFTSDQARWDFVTQHVGDPLSGLDVLVNLNEAEAKGLLRIATPVECRQDSEFIRQGDVCNELNLLIAGKMRITDQTGYVHYAKAGNAFGTVGLFAQTHHQFDATAVTDCEILTISRFSFEKLQRSWPEIGTKLRLNQYKEVK
ncbi:cyclic nucleotide-binding domain-containing protein [Sporomusa sp.]|uniref:cyclic nucleotide-binding domain-containing protein n=1 Tax=Sporomusa sp. TaxID=2078658 RepID=UPI002C732195|nr:cyclic nucleotide-binding domain-containing protein [Sporomusa sp.]HWR06936.1 cyclic nucleotide-binding domain-containing protein [Sporomusa sp.]HWR42322.1 cyclic nucleotide-binding domain-containing protein [Sporomusa sp.]